MRYTNIHCQNPQREGVKRLYKRRYATISAKGFCMKIVTVVTSKTLTLQFFPDPFVRDLFRFQHFCKFIIEQQKFRLVRLHR